MFAYMLTSKPCSEATNILYLSSGVLCVGSSGNQLEVFGKKAEDTEIFGKLNSIGLTHKLLS